MDDIDQTDSVVRVALRQALIAAGAYFHCRGWVPATGGNFSARLGSDCVMVTGSGIHKGELRDSDFLDVDLAGHVQGMGKPSFETALHLQIYRRMPQIGAVLHVHSVANTVLSRCLNKLELSGYELLKTLPGAPGPASRVEVPVFANDQDITRLSQCVDRYMQAQPLLPAYLIAGHGLYAWGADVAQARYRVEALEFMFECELQQRRVEQ